MLSLLKRLRDIPMCKLRRQRCQHPVCPLFPNIAISDSIISWRSHLRTDELVLRSRYRYKRPACAHEFCCLYSLFGPFLRLVIVIRRLLFFGVCLLCAASLRDAQLRAQSISLPNAWRPMQWLNTNTTPHPSVVRVFAPEPDGMSVGSGTLVAIAHQYGMVVTNWHVVRDARGEISVAFPDGFRSSATVLKVDQDWDLAALLIWRPKATPMPIASIPPKPGDSLTIAGYGQGNYRSVRARCTQYVSPGDNFPYEMVEVAAEARDGDSGGPILNDRGELAGVLFGAGRGTTSGSQSSRVQWFLADVWPPQLDPSNTRVASAPTLENPQPFYPNSDAQASQPTSLSDRQPQNRRQPEIARQAEPFRHEQPPTEPSVARSDHPESIRRLAPTNRQRAEAAWSNVNGQRNEPEFVRTSSDDRGKPARNEQGVRPPETDATASPPVSEVDWDWILGDTALEKVKTVLAAIGLFAIVIQMAKWSDREEEAEEESE